MTETSAVGADSPSSTVAQPEHEEPPASSALLAQLSNPGPDRPRPLPTPTSPGRSNNLKPRRPVPALAQNPRTTLFRERFYPDITDSDWNDWRLAVATSHPHSPTIRTDAGTVPRRT
ncbi:MAG UNVERIFIED_CONTAM: hypothetical protein LVR18_18260 [Planctomycetaceae bacterium]